MDRKDVDSPLRTILSYPIKRITPAVPVPDWHSPSPSRPIPSPVVCASPLLPTNIRQTPVQFTSPTPRNNSSIRNSVISNNATTVDSESKNDLRNTELNVQSNLSKPCEISEKPPSTPSKISGEVSFTPTHSAFTPHSVSGSQNPHAGIVPHTPIASGPEQARSSIKLQNCVSTVNLCCELKLLDIYCRTRFSEYNPSRFHGVVMRILEPRATALVFRSGKVVCTGAKNEHESLLAARKFARIIQKLGNPVQFTDFKIQNFVATADLRFPIRLEALQQAHGQFTSYEPELFPGLIYRLVRPRIVLLIFVNGKIVFTGGKSRNDITESLNIIYPILRSFKKN